MFQRQDKQNRQSSQNIGLKLISNSSQKRNFAKILKETRQKNQTGLTEKETEKLIDKKELLLSVTIAKIQLLDNCQDTLFCIFYYTVMYKIYHCIMSYVVSLVFLLTNYLAINVKFDATKTVCVALRKNSLS